MVTADNSGLITKALTDSHLPSDATISMLTLTSGQSSPELAAYIPDPNHSMGRDYSAPVGRQKVEEGDWFRGKPNRVVCRKPAVACVKLFL